MSRITELENLIVTNSENYYEGRASVSDDQWDAWLDELRDLDPQNSIFHKVGWGYDLEKSTKQKCAHMSYLTGIDPKPRVAKDSMLGAGKVKTPKMDGGSVELQYHGGFLIRALTRGDGSIGFDCTKKLSYIVPNILPEKFTGSIVGEYVISSEDLAEFSDSIAQRNVPNGFLGRDYASEEDCKRFSFVAYKICFSPEKKFTKRIEILEFIKSLGFLTVDFILDEVQFQYAMDKLCLIGGKHYLLDGIVASQLEVVYNEDGTISYPNEIAYKTIRATASPKVERIHWNLTRTGRLVPTVITEQIQLSGANIQRFTGHNASYILMNGIGPGAVVEVTRSGEVIPYILDATDPVEAQLPTCCPACGSELVWRGADLACDNFDCSGQNYSRIYHWIKIVAPVKNLGSSLISALVDALEIDSVQDLYKEYDLSKLYQYEGVGSSKVKIVEEMFRELQSPHSLPVYLMALNIRGLGYQSAKKICEQSFIYDEIKQDYFSDAFELDISNAKGVSYSTKVSLLKNWGRLVDMLSLIKVAQPQQEEPTNNEGLLKICITGSLESGTKSQFYKNHADKIVESNVKECDYLVQNEDKGSSKYKTAVKLGKKIITETELINILEGGL